MRGLYRQGVVVAFYALLGLIALYNPLFHLSTHVPGSQPIDYYHFHWNYWWIRHALTTGLNVYETSYVMYPFTSSLALHTLTPFWFPLWALVEPLAGTVAAMTVIFAVIYTLNGCTLYWLLRHFGALPGLALVGGVMLELSPIMLNNLLLTNINVMSWFWLPLLLLIWEQVARWSRGPGARRFQLPLIWVVVLALALWCMVLTDIQYLLFAAFLVVPYGLWTLWQAGTKRAALRLAVWGVLALALALTLLWLAGPLPYLMTYDRTGLSPTPPERAISIPFPQGYLTRLDQGVSLGVVMLPLLALALIVSIIFRRPIQAGVRTHFPTRWFWLALALPPLILSVGAYLPVSDARLPMPYLALHRLLGGQFRYPERFAPVFLIPAVLLIALTFSPLLSRRPRLCRAAIPAVVLLVLADARLFRPVPIQPLPAPYSFYTMLANEPYDYVVVEVPTGGSSGEGLVGDPLWLTTQFYGVTHGKRMVNGHISRVNTWHYWYMRTDDAMMAWLGQRRFLEPKTVEAQMRDRIFNWPVGYFVIHADWIGRSGPTLQEIVGYFNSLPDLFCPPLVEGDAVLYRTRWHPDGCAPRIPSQVESGLYQIDIGSPGDEVYIGWGWHQQETIAGLTLRWAGEYPQTQVYLDLPPGDYQLTLNAQAYAEPRRLRLLVNGQPLPESLTVSPESLRPYTFFVPAALIGDGDHVTISLDYDGWLVPADLAGSGDTRKLALAVDWLEFARQ